MASGDLMRSQLIVFIVQMVAYRRYYEDAENKYETLPTIQRRKNIDDKIMPKLMTTQRRLGSNEKTMNTGQWRHDNDGMTRTTRQWRHDNENKTRMTRE